MVKHSKAGFTLVELIVVVTILAILGTIAFISFNGYTKNARDGVRIADITNLNKSFEIYISKVGTYPLPSNYTDITYSGAIVWKQGTIGESIITNLQTLNNIPLDPLFKNEYTYSVNKYYNEYQIGSIIEGDAVVSNPFFNTAYASVSNPTVYIKGNYNGKILITNTGGQDYVFALPSILTNDLSSSQLEDIVMNKKLIYKDYIGYPSSYIGFLKDVENKFTYLSSGSNFLVFTGELSSDLYGEGIFNMVDNISAAYSGCFIKDIEIETVKNKPDFAFDIWDTVKNIHGLPKLNMLRSCSELKSTGKGEGDGIYHFFSDDYSSVYETYCDMTNGGRTFLFSVNPSSLTWRYDSIQWTKPTLTTKLKASKILTEEMTSGAYGEFKGNEVKICRGNFTNCYIFDHGQNRTLKSFYNIGDSFIEYTRCYPNVTRCNAGELPDDYGDDTKKASFLSIVGSPSISNSSRPRQGLGINVSLKNKIGIQFDHNNGWPDFDNMGYGIGVFRSHNCGRTGEFIDTTRARSVEGVSTCGYLTPDSNMWFVFSK